ncbi:MAG TPA: lysophospholipid acyltransferase family protein [Candidatus Dormibacteraeota bacterium]|nr:lysophospholipid acyltransferase family protein [Candidatus Dormibacteraeota bacterium]
MTRRATTAAPGPTRRRARELRGRSQTPAAAELLTLATEPDAEGARPRRARKAPQRPSESPALRFAPPLVREAIDTIDGRVMGLVEKGRHGSLDERDAAFIERQLRILGPLTDLYFRGEVRGLDNIPAEGPVLMVGNHSGGLVIPDTWVFETHFFRHFGVDRPTYALAHNMVMGLPVIGTFLRRLGTLPAHPDSARDALRQGAAVLVYPGGDEDTFRPWSERNRVHLARRTGFIRLALQERVPIVPVVSIGGQETLFIPSDGRSLARRLGLERFRIKALPMVIAPPWGVSPGDFLFHLPLPAKIVVQCGEAVDFAERFGDLDARDPEVIWACYEYVERRMQDILDQLAAERRYPVLG